MTTFFVAGIPVPKGSAKAFAVKSKKTGKIRAIVTQDNNERQKAWAPLVSHAAQEKGLQPVSGPVAITLVFHMPRPQSHFRTGKNKHLLREDAPIYHTSKTGDLDKLERCVLDALTGIAWDDDCQVCMIRSKKIYHDRPGCIVQIEETP